MEDKIKAAVIYMKNVRLNQGRDWISPTEIGREVGGNGQHSAYGSPICKKAVELGIMERNEQGKYRLVIAGDSI